MIYNTDKRANNYKIPLPLDIPHTLMKTGHNKNHLLIILFAAFFLILAVVFILFPGIDLAFSAMFYNEQDGFFLRENPLVQFSYRKNNYLVATTTLSLIAIAILAAKNKRKYLGLDKKASIFLLLVMVLGPGLIVNNVFKNQWDRARPDKIQEFGGQNKFSPAFIISDQCDKNCSFVSGHAAAIFFFSAIFLLVNNRRRWWVLGSSIIAGSLVGFGRIVQGDHFLSDVIFSFFIVMSVAIILYWFMYSRGNTQKTGQISETESDS